MYGVVKGFQSFNMERDSELNPRIYQRNIPDKPLQPNFNFYPVQTKREKMHIVDNRNIFCKNPKSYDMHNVETNFNPGNAIGPWNGYAVNVDVETQLKKPNCKCDTENYIPSSGSDLFIPTSQSSNLGVNEHPYLFKEQELSTSRKPYQNFDKIFNNSTRC